MLAWSVNGPRHVAKGTFLPVFALRPVVRLGFRPISVYFNLDFAHSMRLVHEVVAYGQTTRHGSPEWVRWA